MSISNSLSNALSGMTAASRMAEIVSSNVSNALTDGYARRSLDLASGINAGNGVEIGTVIRHVDRGLLSDRRLAGADLGAYDALLSTMSGIQDIVGTPGNGDALSSRIVAVESALIEAASDPSSTTRLAAVGNRLQDLAAGLNGASHDIQTERARADASIADQVDQLNTALVQVEQLNADIVNTRNAGRDVSGLLDQRQKVVDQIAEIVPVRELNRDGGQIALMTPNGEMLIDGRAKQFGFTENPVITADMTMASGGLSGLTIEGVPIAADGIGKLDGGTLGAAFQARDGELVAAQTELDMIAADLISRFQDPAVDPTLGTGQPGLLTDAGAAYDVANITGLASRIAVNSAVDPNAGGVVTNLRDGINAAGPGLSGDTSLLQSLSSALSDPRATTGDPTLQGAAGRAATFEADIGTRRLNFEAEVSFAGARWASLSEAEAAEGVNTDFEMQMLLRVEQAYAANARVIQTVDSMIQRLMEI